MCARHLQCTFRRQKCATYAPQVIYTFYMTLLSQSDMRNLQALPNLWQIMCARARRNFSANAHCFTPKCIERKEMQMC